MMDITEKNKEGGDFSTSDFQNKIMDFFNKSITEIV
jgi:hypothetical protein